jgi:hypothetical protein
MGSDKAELDCSFLSDTSIDVHMKTFCHVLGEALRQRPTERMERWTPWIIGVLGTIMLGLMAYAWAAAWMG